MRAVHPAELTHSVRPDERANVDEEHVAHAIAALGISFEATAVELGSRPNECRDRRADGLS